MSKSDTAKAAKPETPFAANSTAATPAKPAELKDSDLDNVAGGINPQPLPPRASGLGSGSGRS